MRSLAIGMTVASQQVVVNAPTLEDARRGHAWATPAHYNIAEDCVGTWARQPATRDRPALIVDDLGQRITYSWRQLYDYTLRFANVLRGEFGVKPGNVVAVIGGQQVEAAIAYMALYYIGAVALPIAKVIGPNGIHYRIQHSRAVLAVAPSQVVSALNDVGGTPTPLPAVMTDVDDAKCGFWNLLAAAPRNSKPTATGRRTPALLIYSSGTTGAPSGCLHGQQVALAHANMSYLCNDFRNGDVYYSTADWAWIAGLGSGLLGPWSFGVPVVVSSAPFSPVDTVELMRRNGVTAGLLPPTVLRHLKMADVDLDVSKLRNLVSGGEPVTGELWDWARERLSLSFSSGYGQSEANLTIGTPSMWGSSPSLGRQLPGHDVAILDDSGLPAGDNQAGEITLRVTPDNPSIMLEYFDDAAGTARKFSGGWLHTGDMGRTDHGGNIWLLGRADDIIKTSGYRVGPDEIEAAILQHDAVAGCVAVGIPDPIRGQLVAVVVQLRPGERPSDHLSGQIRDAVKAAVGVHAYPRQTIYVEHIPRTDAGKISRTLIRHQLADRTLSEVCVPQKTKWEA